MTVHQESNLRPSVEQDPQALRAELDELLRARQYAAQRERRLAETVRDAGLPGPDHRYAQPQGHADPELLRRLDQARHLREELGVRCLELSERLLAVEDRLRLHAPAPVPPQGTAVPAPAPVAAPVSAPRRKRPTGARFGGVYEEEAAAPPTQEAAAPPTPSTPYVTGARFGGGRGGTSGRPAAPQDTAPRPGAEPDRSLAPERPQPAVHRARSSAELTALAERIAGLHRRGSAPESAALVAQGAVTLAPTDVARLTALLRSGGPAGSAAYLARAVAHGAPDHAAATLAELRRAGLVAEAAELFHALWGYPAAALPGLLAALEAGGQGADGQTLLWEWGSAPPADLAALAGHLHAAGRPTDTRTLLRQAAARPVLEVSALVAALDGPLAVALLRELVALRRPTDLALVGEALAAAPALYGALLAALAETDEGRRRDTSAALRVAGLPTVPAEPVRARRGRR